MAEGSTKVLYAAFAANIGIAITKGIAAFVTGSSAMIAETVHSTSDSMNQILLLYGQRRAKKPADEQHPLGYGRELYFWGFVVAILVFALGAGVSIYEGILHILNPHEMTSPIWNYAVLLIAGALEGRALMEAIKEFNEQRGDAGFWEGFRRSKDPATFVSLFEDSAALIGVLLALIFISLSLITGIHVFDGIGSLLIGCVLATVAFLLARESKQLLIGEHASPELEQDLKDWLAEQEGVVSVIQVVTMQLSPDQVMAIITVDIDDEMEGGAVEDLSFALERGAYKKFEQLFRVFVRPQEAHDDDLDPTAQKVG